MNAALVLQLLNIAVAGAAAIEQLTRIRAQVEAMVEEGREPTEAEWADLLTDIDGLSARLNA